MSENMTCEHRGNQVGEVIATCCGGGEKRSPLYSCNCESVREEYTHAGAPGKIQIELIVDGVRQPRRIDIPIASCAGCPFSTVSAPEVETPAQKTFVEVRRARKLEQLKPLPITGDTKHKSPTRRMWEDLRRKRESPYYAPNIVLNVDTHGYGDAITAAWIAEGAKHGTPTLSLVATGGKASLLRMLGQNIVDISTDITAGEEYLGSSLAVGSPPVAVARARRLGISGYPQRPTVMIESSGFEWASQHVADVILYPQCTQVNRTWPYVYWEELYQSLKSRGYRVKVAGMTDPRWLWCDDWLIPRTWHEHAALMMGAKVIIGNDSAPAHLSGTIDKPTIALLGRTTDAVFAIYPSVRCLSAERREVPCVGCWSGWGYVPEVCNHGCVALSHITPEQVLTEIWKLV